MCYSDGDQRDNGCLQFGGGAVGTKFPYLGFLIPKPPADPTAGFNKLLPVIKAGERIDTSTPLTIIHKGEVKSVALSDLLDKPLVFTVFMKCNTPSCDRQVQGLTDNAEFLTAKGFNVMAVSRDGVKSLTRYAEKTGIPYILASDPDSLVPKATNSIVEKQMYGRTFEGPARSAYVIGTDGTVLTVIESVETRHHGEEILKAIESLNQAG